MTLPMFAAYVEQAIDHDCVMREELIMSDIQNLQRVTLQPAISLF